MMKFDEILTQVRLLLEQEGRVSYRALKRRFEVDDEYLEDLKAELIDAKRIAADEDGKVLVWIGTEGKGENGPASQVQSLESKQVQGSRSKVQSQEAQPLPPSAQPLTPSTHAEAKAEACFQKALAIVQKQHAKSLELRAATSLARLWQQQGKQKEAHQMLADIYNWFTEGFDTKDLQEAKALIKELAAT
jgi:hypothetical protein